MLSVVLCCVKAERGATDRYGASEEVGTRERSELKICGCLYVTVLADEVQKLAIVR